MNDLAIRSSDMPLMDLGAVLSNSGYFQDTRDVNQAVVKVLAGRELGIGPVTSMTGIHVIKGKPTLGANLMAATVKRSGRYNYRVRELTDQKCVIEFFERAGDKWEPCGPPVEFTAADARRAGTQNMGRFPKNMLFARAMSNGAKWYCPDVFGGPVYSPDELGAEVDEDGEYIDVLPVAARTAAATAPVETPMDDNTDGGQEAAPPEPEPGDDNTPPPIAKEQDQQIRGLLSRLVKLGFSIDEFRADWLPSYGAERVADLNGRQAADCIFKLELEIQQRQTGGN